MTKFPRFEDIKLFFDWGCYTKEDLADFVKWNCLTKEEYKAICGEIFAE